MSSLPQTALSAEALAPPPVPRPEEATNVVPSVQPQSKRLLRVLTCKATSKPMPNTQESDSERPVIKVRTRRDVTPVPVDTETLAYLELVSGKRGQAAIDDWLLTGWSDRGGSARRQTSVAERLQCADARAALWAETKLAAPKTAEDNTRSAQ